MSARCDHDWIREVKWYLCRSCGSTEHPASCYDGEGIRDCACGLEDAQQCDQVHTISPLQPNRG